MKLLIATGLYPPDIGGPATYTVFLEKYAHALGISLVVVPFGEVRKYPPIVRHCMYLSKLIMKSRGCDALYALDTISVGVPAFIASIISGRQFVLRVPGDYAWEQGQQRYGVTETLDEFRAHNNHPLPVRIMSKLQAWVARHAAYVIVPSDYIKSVVVGWGVHENRITRIYSELSELSSEGKRDTHTVSNVDDYIVTTAARLVPWKGVHALIDVVVSLRKDGIPVQLNIIGGGTCRNDLEEKVLKLKARDYIQFLGVLSREALASALSKSDVFVLNTSYEGLSHQLIEVMSMGIPIITTPVGGNVELITHEETGLMAPYNDQAKLREAIVRLRNDRTLARSLSERAKQTVLRFHEDRIVEEHRAFITHL